MISIIIIIIVVVIIIITIIPIDIRKFIDHFEAEKLLVERPEYRKLVRQYNELVTDLMKYELEVNTVTAIILSHPDHRHLGGEGAEEPQDPPGGEDACPAHPPSQGGLRRPRR